MDAYYTGYTSDLEKRMNEHNTGMSTFSSKADDWKLMHTEEFENRELAHKRELEIKKKKAGSIFNGRFKKLINLSTKMD